MTTLYGIVDTAQDDRLYEWVKATPEHACLFAGKLDPVLERASPFILNLDKAPSFLARWDTEGRGKNWGIRCFSERPLVAVRRHFRHFLQAKLPDGRVVLFRFYDPRVWTVFLPTCKSPHVEAWFDHVEEYVAEIDAFQTVVYFLSGGKLQARRRSIADPGEQASIAFGDQRMAQPC
jgi:hypothetical protein